MRPNSFSKAMSALVVVALLTLVCRSESRPLKLIRQWKGSVADEALMADTPVYISSTEDFDKLREKWKVSGKKPRVNFSKQIVVVVVSRGSVLNLRATLDDNEDLAVIGQGTRDFRPGFRYVMAVVSREGIKTVNGKELLPRGSLQNKATVTGRVTYRQRVALPPGAVVEVSLLDVSRTDTPGVVFDKVEIKPTTQVPIPFTLSYDPNKIDKRHSYGVLARILVDGKPWFASTTRNMVITQGHPTNIDIVVDMIGSDK